MTGQPHRKKVPLTWHRDDVAKILASMHAEGDKRFKYIGMPAAYYGVMGSVHVAIDISAPAERVWQAVTDIESWPRWTPSTTDVKRLDTGPLQVGSRARVRQPGLPTLVWEVTELNESSAFTWITRIPGVLSTARHDISETEGGSRLTLTLSWSGPLAGIVASLNVKRARNSMTQEANGHKAASEVPES